MDLATKKQLRTAFVKWVYDQAGGGQRELAEPQEFTVPGGWTGEKPTDDDVADAIEWLEGQRLVKAHWTFGGLPSVQLTHAGIREIERAGLPSVQLTNAGIREIEQAIDRPGQPTEHFVPLVNITNIHGSVYGSQLQQGSPGASQTGTFTVDQRSNSEAFIAEARKLLDHVDSDVRVRAEADLDVMERELKGGNPRGTVLAAIGQSVRDYLTAAAGAATSAALAALPWP